MQGFFVTGTDTDVGKTVVSAWLVGRLGASYWKPVQAGNHPETDSEIVRRLAGAPPERILAEAYLLPEPIAPHEAARRAGTSIDMAKLAPPPCDGVLIVEGAGGLLVPLNDKAYVIDLAAELHLPIILVARSTAEHAYRRVVVPCEFAPPAKRALLLAVALAPDASLDLVHCVEEAGKEAVTHEWLRRLGSELAPGRKLETHVEGGPPAAAVLALAGRMGADLIVAGKQGRSRAGDLVLGSVTRRILADSRCDVLVAPLSPA